MSKNVAMFVDVANMYYAARGQDVDVDYVALLKHATKGRDLIRAYAYTGLDPENENQRKFIDFLGKNGYKPVVKDIRKFGDGRMKANLDIELVVDLFRLADRMDIAVIVSGDGDFAPAIKALQDKGVRCEVISFKPNTSSDLIAVADEFMDIMKIASISRKEGRALRDSMSAPEMPAKEVTPEFGFREASPSVAAAALAALKTGGATAPRRGRAAGTSSRRAAAPAEQPPGEAVVAPTGNGAVAEAGAESPEEQRRRRRRRGGRGRGRGRRAEEMTAEAGTEPTDEEIGWEEFDDLSQLDGVKLESEEAEGEAGAVEYGFEEADAATLAELGLTPEEIAAMTTGPTTAEAAEEEKPKRRSTRSRKAADTDGGAVQAAEAAEEEKPKRRSTRSRKAADTDGEAAEATAEEKPKRRSTRSRSADEGEKAGAEEEKPKRRSTRSRKAADPDAKATDSAEEEKPRRRSTRSRRTAGDGESDPRASAPADESAEPQGIWGRFRAARSPRGTSGD